MDRNTRLQPGTVTRVTTVAIFSFGLCLNALASNHPLFSSPNPMVVLPAKKSANLVRPVGPSSPFGSQIEKLTLTQQPHIQDFLSSGENQLSAHRSHQSHFVRTQRFQHFYKGIEVMGSQALHHQGPRGTQVADHLARFDLESMPTLTENEAVGIMLSYHPARDLGTLPKLRILPFNGQARLAYWMSLEATHSAPGRDLVVDAHSGDLLVDMSHEISLTSPAVVKVYSGRNVPEDFVDKKSGAPLKFDLEVMDHLLTNNTPVDPEKELTESALRAAKNARQTLDYYFTHHGRNSFDGAGAEVVNVVHAGRAWANASWNPMMGIMAYGDGDGKVMGDLTKSLDVAGHELTHGVISHTSNLLYFGESGALNEAMADFFGKMIESEGQAPEEVDWILGRSVFIHPQLAKKGIRNLAQPSSNLASFRDSSGEFVRQPFPETYGQKFIALSSCGPQNDNCWVHVNSTIFSHATYRIVQAIGRDKAQKMLYLALTQYMTPISGLRHGRDGVMHACELMYKAETCSKVEEAFKAVDL